MLSNVPAEKATGLELSNLYSARWMIETAFADVERLFDGEPIDV